MAALVGLDVATLPPLSPLRSQSTAAIPDRTAGSDQNVLGFMRNMQIFSISRWETIASDASLGVTILQIGKICERVYFDTFRSFLALFAAFQPLSITLPNWGASGHGGGRTYRASFDAGDVRTPQFCDRIHDETRSCRQSFRGPLGLDLPPFVALVCELPRSVDDVSGVNELNGVRDVFCCPNPLAGKNARTHRPPFRRASHRFRT